MIVLNSVSKEIGQGDFRRLVVDDVTWTIPRHAHIAIFGHRGTGVSHLLDLIAGSSLPTKGWVTRSVKTSIPGGYIRFAGFGTVRALIERLSVLYSADPREVREFIEIAMQSRQVLDVPVRQLPPAVKRQLNFALIYAVPCEMYLFDGGVAGVGDPAFRALCQAAFNVRRKQAGTILALNSSAAGLGLDSSTVGAILHRGKLTLYEHMWDALAVFDTLPPEEAIPNLVRRPEAAEAEQEEFI